MFELGVLALGQAVAGGAFEEGWELYGIGTVAAGRRIELGEVDAALQALPDVAGAAAAVRTTAGGHQVLVGYLVPSTGAELDLAAAKKHRAAFGFFRDRRPELYGRLVEDV